MDTIIIKPRSSNEYKEVITILKKLNVKTEIYKERSKEHILKSIERGAREADNYLKGKAQLQDAKSLLSEL